MIHIAFCEDNEFQRALMEDILEDYIQDREIDFTLFSSGEDLLKHVKTEGKFDIYILDVVMPGINGMEVATTLRQMDDECFIIFATASLEYAVLSYDVGAFYYLTKPLDREKLCRVLDKACAKLGPDEETFEVRTKCVSKFLKIRDIIYVELNDRAPFYYCRDGQILEGLKLRRNFRDTIAPLLENPMFVQCGVGLVVNMQYVDTIDSESMLLCNGKQLFFPKSAYGELKRAWKLYAGQEK